MITVYHNRLNDAVAHTDNYIFKNNNSGGNKNATSNNYNTVHILCLLGSEGHFSQRGSSLNHYSHYTQHVPECGHQKASCLLPPLDTPLPTRKLVSMAGIWKKQTGLDWSCNKYWYFLRALYLTAVWEHQWLLSSVKTRRIRDSFCRNKTDWSYCHSAHHWKFIF